MILKKIYLWYLYDIPRINKIISWSVACVILWHTINFLLIILLFHGWNENLLTSKSVILDLKITNYFAIAILLPDERIVYMRRNNILGLYNYLDWLLDTACLL